MLIAFGKFQHLSRYCGSVKLKLQMEPGYWFLWDMISNITTVSFFLSFFKNTLESSWNFCLMKIMWKKYVKFYTPVSIAMWRLLIMMFTELAYYHTNFLCHHKMMNDKFVYLFCFLSPTAQQERVVQHHNQRVLKMP